MNEFEFRLGFKLTRVYMLYMYICLFVLDFPIKYGGCFDLAYLVLRRV